jgi:hypothetical protein
MPSDLVLQNATRRVAKATYVPLSLSATGSSSELPTQSVQKFGFIRQLQLQPGDVDRLQAVIETAATLSTDLAVTSDSIPWTTLKSFEGTPMTSQLPSPSVFATVPSANLLALGNALVSLRKQSLGDAHGQESPDAVVSGAALNLLNATILSTQVFEANVTATPVGMLNLERLDMTPAGIERGELLATIPLAPLERTSVVQKEWSAITQDFTSVVTDSLENYSEQGVTDNTDLSQSTTNQSQYSNQFNINSTASGGIGFVSGSVSAGFTAQNAGSHSATVSQKHAVETTRKASSRVKQEHKMTISTSTVEGSSETSTRILQNPSPTDPMRVDYFSLMRKWYVGLYRYGLRLTYDLVIPAPGGTLREIYMQLADLQSKASEGFSFPYAYSDITSMSYPGLSEQFGAAVDPPPEATQILTVGGDQVQGLSTSGGVVTFWPLTINVPDGYWITSIELIAEVGGNYSFRVLGYDMGGPGWSASSDGEFIDQILGGFLDHAEGTQTVTCYFRSANPAAVTLLVTAEATPTAMAQWQATAWGELYSAAQTTYYNQQQTISAEIQALQNEISNVDTLTLRREENDEVMKGVLRWLLGPSFDFMPPDVINLFSDLSTTQSAGQLVNALDQLNHGVSFTGNDLFSDNPKAQQANIDWTTMFQYQEMVKFINEAIEWDNVIYFLYSYFWDAPPAWDFIRQIQHDDATRQAFLRAGSARVVLTIQPGWEQAFVSFVETGGFDTTLDPDHPYMTIASEIQAYDETNYPGIPPANPDGSTPPDAAQYVSTTCSAQVPASPDAAVTIEVASSVGFTTGYQAIIDVWDASSWDPNTQAQGTQESQLITAVPDATHITVAQLVNAHDGTVAPFPVIQSGECGQLIAEWFEYTPTSGTDIAISSDLATSSLPPGVIA